MATNLPSLLTSETAEFDKFPNALLPGSTVEWREEVESQRTPLGVNEKKFGRVTNISPSGHIHIIIYKPPTSFDINIQRAIGPLRHSTLQSIPELVETDQTQIISSHQVVNLIHVLPVKEVIDGELSLSKMLGYYII